MTATLIGKVPFGGKLSFVAQAIKQEDKEYAEVKQNLRTEISNLRQRVKAMMSENEKAGEIEKLNHHEFDLDLEEQRRMQAEGEADVTRVGSFYACSARRARALECVSSRLCLRCHVAQMLALLKHFAGNKGEVVSAELVCLRTN